MNRKLTKPPVQSPLNSRTKGRSEDAGLRDQPNPWLGDAVARKLEEGRALITQLATDLPFTMVLRGRLAPPNKALIAQTEPLCQVLDHFRGALPRGVDTADLRLRHGVIASLTTFEQSCENFTFLVRRAKNFLSAQLERSLASAYETAIAAGNKDLDEALLPYKDAFTKK